MKPDHTGAAEFKLVILQESFGGWDISWKTGGGNPLKEQVSVVPNPDLVDLPEIEAQPVNDGLMHGNLKP